MSDDIDISAASTSEVAFVARDALERLTSRHVVLTPAERATLTSVRVAAIGELARREQSAKDETKAAANAARVRDINSELNMHLAAGEGDTEEAERERKLRAFRVGQLTHEKTMLENGFT